MPNACTDSKLPEIPYIETENATTFFEHSTVVSQGGEILLHDFEYPREKHLSGAHYWTILEADTAPLFVCSLDIFATRLSEKNPPEWSGRRADYLVIGTYKGKCYVVVIELRKQLTTPKQFYNPKKPKAGKQWQVENSLGQIVTHLLPIFSTSEQIDSVCTDRTNYKLLGLIIPSTRSKSRAMQTTLAEIEGYSQVPILTISHTQITNCKIAWSKMIGSVIP